MTDDRRPPSEPPDKAPAVHVGSRVIVNTGHGKGKTTAALGTAMRAVARGWKVCVVQFMKSEKWKVGEQDAGIRLGMEWWTLGDGFTWESPDMDITRTTAVAAWDAARAKLRSGDYDMLVFDEITYPMNWAWISTQEVVDAIRSRPPQVNVVATGRDAPAELIAVADTVTEMVKVRHAFDEGIRARRGIEF
ncbi:MAG: cob(I)yrinic acid a,c-diamide adenosyltransferase [Actinomycetota bacterium]